VARRKEINALINLTMFTIWKERINRFFENKHELEAKVADKIVTEWCILLLAWRVK
jgi:hypothetical protein